MPTPPRTPKRSARARRNTSHRFHAKKPAPTVKPEALDAKQIAACAILLADMPLPPQMRGILPVAIEARMRDKAKRSKLDVFFDGGSASLKNKKGQMVEIRVRDFPEAIAADCVAAGSAPVPITRHDMDAALREGLELAWGIIANAGNPPGMWEGMPQEWQEAAARWRDRWLAEFGPPRHGKPRRVTIPEKFMLGGQEITVLAKSTLMAPHSPKMAACDTSRGLIFIQTPTEHYQPARATLEKVFVHEKLSVALASIGRPDLLKDTGFMANLSSALHQIEATQSGDLDVLENVKHCHEEE